MFIPQLAALVCVSLLVTQPTEKPSEPYPQLYAANIEMWWRALPFIDRIHAAADAGFTQVEFWPWRGKDIEAIAEVCKERGVRSCAIHSVGVRSRNE